MFIAKESLYKNGDINEDVVIPDVTLFGMYKDVYFSCDEDLFQYSIPVCCDGDDPIAVMTVEDKIGNRIELDLRVVGEIKVNWKGKVYTHYSQFPEDLIEYVKNEGNFNDENCPIESRNYIGLRYTSYNYKDEEVYSDDIIFDEDMSEITQEKLKTVLLKNALWVLDAEYKDKTFEKPEYTLSDVFDYANKKYAEADSGDEITICDFPIKSVNTVFTRESSAEAWSWSYKISLWRDKDNKLLAETVSVPYCNYYNDIIDIATGERTEFIGTEMKLKDILKEEI